MLTLAEAVESRRVVDLRYQDRRGAPSRRDIHPHGLAANVGRWYLVATDADAGEDRTFRVDRIRTARARCTTFPARAEPVSEAGLTDRFADADYRWRVVLHVDASAARLRDHLPSSVARIEPLAAGPGEPDPDRRWHRAEIHAERLDWIPAVIAALGCEVVVETPDELRDLMRETADRMRRAAVPAEPR
nr:WYL domain-containing protein [Cellulomonas sp. RIT-PI-Y]